MQCFTSAACVLPTSIFLSIACRAQAQSGNDTSARNFPSRPIRFIVPYPPGGGTAIVARELAPFFVEAWRQQVIIDNRGGASATIGHGITGKATPDGYTMM